MGIKVDAPTFRKACRDYARKQVDRQREDFIRLGVTGDWNHPYMTMDYKYEADIIRSLGKIITNGHVHKGVKPVHWCIECGSALAEAEVEYENKTSPAIDVRFSVLDEEAFFKRCHHVEGHAGEGPVSVLIWTTTPWTLPANQAVALNPELEYVVVQCTGNLGSERFVVAQELLKNVMGRYGLEEYRVVAYFRGADLEGLKLRHPFYQREVPIILGEHVTLEAGTGAVHTAPGHGQDDYVVGMRYGLKVENPVGGDGRFLADTELFAGESVLQSNGHVIEVLKSKGALVHEEALLHSYPHCWRHKTPIIFRATPQWFVSMDQNGLRSTALEAIENARWIPGWGEARISGMVANRPDWCISRQRTWGVPIPVFVHKKTGELHPKTDWLVEEVALHVEAGGIDAWFDLDIDDLLGNDAPEYDKATDTLDVWFDSGVSHACVLEQRKELQYPADLYLEGSDQHRGWFQSSLLTSVGIHGNAPYKSVLTHGFTVDAKGQKMSKSRGNVIAPQKVANTLGADILRLWVAATDYRGEMSVSDEILKRMSDAYRRIRNTARFLLANLNGFDPVQHQVSTEQLLALDQWAIERAAQLQREIIQAYDSYEFHLIYQKVHNFCSVDMGSFYLDIIKDRQYTTPTNSLARRSAQTAMFHVIQALACWLAPVLSFTAEEIWSFVPGQRSESVFLDTWYTFPPIIETKFSSEFWSKVVELRNEVSKELEHLRVAGGIGSSLDAEVDLYCEKELYNSLGRLEDELRFIFITSYARIHTADQRPEEAMASAIEGLWIKVAPSDYEKCTRCWHHREDVGAHTEHPQLCGRCVDNVGQAGEVRRYA